MLSIIAAVSENGVIGKNNSLIWSLPSDLKRVKEITLTGSRTLIMGRRTFEGLPGILPGRKHVVLTGDRDYKVNHENIEIVHSVDELKNYVESPEEYFVFGGGKIYSLLLPFVSKMYITRIHKSFEGDTYFPEIDMREWRIIEELEGTVDKDNLYPHTYITLGKI